VSARAKGRARRAFVGVSIVPPILGALWALPALLGNPATLSERLPGWLLVIGALSILGLGLAWGSFRGPLALRVAFANLLGLGLLLLAGEAFSQILGLHVPGISRPDEGGDRGAWVHDPELGWFHRPGRTGRTDLGGPDSGSFRINSLGLRGAEVRLPKPPGCSRVLAFGDSFVFGVGVDEENLFTTRLAERLRDATSECVEVVNMGVTGYSTDQEYLLLKRLGERLSPDVVLLVICDNDFEGNQLDFAYRRYYKPWFALDETEHLLPDPHPAPRLTRFQRVKEWMGQESNVWNLLRTRRSDNATLQRLVDFFQVAIPRVTPRPIKLTGALAEAFVGHARSLGAGVLVLNTGHRGEDPGLFAVLQRRLSEAGVETLELHQALEERRRLEPRRHWDFEGDTHWNRDAHAFVADRVADHLLAVGLLRSRSRGVRTGG
jgi:lysophospholipase L1-like esterase